MFEKEIYVKRRENLKAAFQSGKLLFLGNDECGINYVDNTYYYRQDSTFLYYFGISKPGLVALIDIDEDAEYLFGDDATIDLIVWTGSQPRVAEMAERVGVRRTGDLSDFRAKIAGYDKSSVRFLPPYRPEHILKLHEWLGYPVRRWRACR